VTDLVAASPVSVRYTARFAACVRSHFTAAAGFESRTDGLRPRHVEAMGGMACRLSKTGGDKPLPYSGNRGGKIVGAGFTPARLRSQPQGLNEFWYSLPPGTESELDEAVG
jgi:hypothetical protein